VNWFIERDANGHAVRMHWIGRYESKNKSLPKPKGCLFCGFPDGWHTRACRMQHPSASVAQDK
jgi:hypothetical protein